jgi:hypothetical protein
MLNDLVLNMGSCSVNSFEAPNVGSGPPKYCRVHCSNFVGSPTIDSLVS